jgi:TonB-linked SusC/RagA family outer membrane protein
MIKRITAVFILLLTVQVALLAQTRTVTGVISDQSGETLPGASVQIKGTTKGVIADNNGKYSITVSGDKVSLVISFVGYGNETVNVGDKTTVNVTLNESAQSIEEVVVTGYGSQRRVTLSGSVAAITSEELITTKSIDVQNSLTGKLAGVKVVQGSSEPGDFDATSFSVRGMGTPLFVIDGVPRENIMRLDQNEVESISILKDASAAIYGARAANGVVLVTTKQGKKDSKFTFDYTGYVGMDNYISEVQALDAMSYMSLKNEQRLNSGEKVILYPVNSFIPYMTGDKQSSDWVNEFVKPHPLRMQHSINASGGSKNINYFVNFGYADQQGRWTTGDANYGRFNLRSNVTAELLPGLEAKVMLNLMRDKREEQAESSWRVFNNSWSLYPIDPIFLPEPGDASGTPNENYPYNVPTTHPGVITNSEVAGYTHYTQSLVQSNMQLEWKIPYVDGLKVRGMYSYDYTVNDTKEFRKLYVLYNRDYTTLPQGTPHIRTDYLNKNNTMMQLEVSYNKTFSDNHNLSLLALYEESDRQATNFYVQRRVLIGSVEEVYAGDAGDMLGDQNRDNIYHYTNKAAVGRLNYDYAGKYMFTFNFRYDGSSKFAAKHQWGFFPGVSAAWRLSEEKFIKESSSLKFITNLKLRGSYGVMGDDSALAYQFLSGYEYPFDINYQGFGGYIVNGSYINSVSPTGIPNTTISWTKSTTTNIGLDVELWKGLLGVIAEVFQRDRRGLLANSISVILPDQVGVDLPQENINSDRTVGAELTLTHRNKIKDWGLSYHASGYITLDRNKITYFQRVPSTSSYDNWKKNPSGRWGYFDSNNKEQMDFFWGYKYLGQYQSFDEIFASGVIYDGKGNAYMLPGDLIYEDYNKDGVIDANDEHPIAIKHPAFAYGFTLGGEWKGIDLNMTFQGTGMNRKRLQDYGGHFEKPLDGDVSGLQVFADRWHRTDGYSTDNGPSDGSAWTPGYYPSMYSAIPNRDFVTKASDFWIMSSDYLRLKTLELGYTLPSSLTKKVKIDRARIFFNGYNLFTLTSMKIMDPEQSGQYPLSRTFSMGINVVF